MVTNVDSIILDRYSFMYIMSIKKMVTSVDSKWVNENETDSI